MFEEEVIMSTLTWWTSDDARRLDSKELSRILSQSYAEFIYRYFHLIRVNKETPVSLEWLNQVRTTFDMINQNKALALTSPNEFIRTLGKLISLEENPWSYSNYIKPL